MTDVPIDTMDAKEGLVHASHVLMEEDIDSKELKLLFACLVVTKAELCTLGVHKEITADKERAESDCIAYITTKNLLKYIRDIGVRCYAVLQHERDRRGPRPHFASMQSQVLHLLATVLSQIQQCLKMLVHATLRHMGFRSSPDQQSLNNLINSFRVGREEAINTEEAEFWADWERIADAEKRILTGAIFTMDPSWDSKDRLGCDREQYKRGMRLEGVDLTLLAHTSQQNTQATLGGALQAAMERASTIQEETAPQGIVVKTVVTEIANPAAPSRIFTQTCQWEEDVEYPVNTALPIRAYSANGSVESVARRERRSSTLDTQTKGPHVFGTAATDESRHPAEAQETLGTKEPAIFREAQLPTSPADPAAANPAMDVACAIQSMVSQLERQYPSSKPYDSSDCNHNKTRRIHASTPFDLVRPDCAACLDNEFLQGDAARDALQRAIEESDDTSAQRAGLAELRRDYAMLRPRLARYCRDYKRASTAMQCMRSALPSHQRAARQFAGSKRVLVASAEAGRPLRDNQRRAFAADADKLLGSYYQLATDAFELALASGANGFMELGGPAAVHKAAREEMVLLGSGDEATFETGTCAPLNRV